MTWRIEQGDWIEILRTMPDESVHCVVTSPPYWGLRDYGVSGQLGLERTPDEYVAKMVEGFREVRRVLRDDGTLWLNLGDSYFSPPTGGLSSKPSLMTGGRTNQAEAAKRPSKMVDGCKTKDLCGIPWMVAFALRSDGWYLRQDIIWAKGQSGDDEREGNVMPESVRDRCTKSHEYIFLLSKSERYYYDADAIKEPAQDWGKRDRSNWRGGTEDPRLKHHGFEDCDHPLGNRRSVWRVNPTAFREAHFATFPPEIPETCIKAGCPEGGTVLDPFCGSGTTGMVAKRLMRNFVGIELNPKYVEMAERRITQDAPLFNTPNREPMSSDRAENA